MLDESGMLADILPEIAAMKGVEQPPEYHPEGDVWVHTLMLLEQLDHPTPTLALGALLHDVGKPPTFRVAERIRFDGHVEDGVRIAHDILNRLRFSRDEMEQVEALVANHMKFKDVPQMKESTLKRFLRLPCFDEHLELHRLDCLSSNKRLENYEMVREKLGELIGRTSEARAPAHGCGPDRGRLRAWSAVFRNPQRRRRRAVGRANPHVGRGHGACARAISDSAVIRKTRFWPPGCSCL